MLRPKETDQALFSCLESKFFREENVRNCRVREAWAVLVEGPERLLGTAQELPKGADVSSGHSGEGSTEFLVFKICTITFKN